MPELGTTIGWVSLVLGIASAAVGLVLVWGQRNVRPPAPPTEEKLKEQGAITDVIDSTTNFAKALKDLDRGIQLIILGVLFIAVASVAAGFETVADAIESAAGAGG